MTSLRQLCEKGGCRPVVAVNLSMICAKCVNDNQHNILMFEIVGSWVGRSASLVLLPHFFGISWIVWVVNFSCAPHEAEKWVAAQQFAVGRTPYQCSNSNNITQQQRCDYDS